MNKSQIYTRSGDKGETGLVSGTRTRKSNPRIDMYGEVDELNSRIGYVASLLQPHLEHAFAKEIYTQLTDIQSALFNLGSNLACEAEQREAWRLPNLTEKMVKQIEEKIDHMDHELPKLTNFILPGGSILASAIHLSRTNTRKVERLLVHFQDSENEALPELSIIYINRLSDYFFVLARYVNLKLGVAEILWKAEKV